MTSKERAALRAQANSIEPLFQVGKGGVSEALIKQVDDALRARELIKLRALLETIPEEPRPLARQIAAATGAEVVQVIGGSIILYRYNPELHQPVKKVRPKKLTKEWVKNPKRRTDRKFAPKPSAPYSRKGR